MLKFWLWPTQGGSRRYVRLPERRVAGGMGTSVGAQHGISMGVPGGVARIELIHSCETGFDAGKRSHRRGRSDAARRWRTDEMNARIEFALAFEQAVTSALDTVARVNG